MKQSFEEFMRKVDTYLNKKCGLDPMCLSDYCYRDAYDNGERPASVGKQVLANEGWED